PETLDAVRNLLEDLGLLSALVGPQLLGGLSQGGRRARHLLSSVGGACVDLLLEALARLCLRLGGLFLDLLCAFVETFLRLIGRRRRRTTRLGGHVTHGAPFLRAARPRRSSRCCRCTNAAAKPSIRSCRTRRPLRQGRGCCASVRGLHPRGSRQPSRFRRRSAPRP